MSAWPTWPCRKCGLPVGPGLDGDWVAADLPYGYDCPADEGNHETTEEAWETARRWALESI